MFHYIHNRYSNMPIYNIAIHMRQSPYNILPLGYVSHDITVFNWVLCPINTSFCKTGCEVYLNCSLNVSYNKTELKILHLEVR
jgi:hypothetical protein